MTTAATTESELIDLGVQPEMARRLSTAVDAALRSGSAAEGWSHISREILGPSAPFAAHKLIYDRLYADWDHQDGPPPAWIPSETSIRATNIGALLAELDLDSYEQLHRWSVEHRAAFWTLMVERLGIPFITPADRVVVDESEWESPHWLPGAKLNIADACFIGSPDDVAILHRGERGELDRMTVGALEALTNRVAAGLIAMGVEPGDAVAIDMPMTAESVAIYLGIIRAGAVVVSIADSFAPEEVATRLRIAVSKIVFTQDQIARGGRLLPLYDRVVAAGAQTIIVLPLGERLEVELRADDRGWADFLADDDAFISVGRDPHDHSNILFSSGTTGDPKAIPWSHATPIKCVADAWLHHDIRPGNVLAWPTNLGWMMGPWLIYAALVNRAAMALYQDVPTGAGFGRFVEEAGVTMLGVVPSLVSAWRQSGCMEGLDWSAIRAFSSTGECSNAEDMLYLMSLAGYKPVIEYCGGTEIGGGYITGTLVQPSCPATFSTPALGLDLVILDEQGQTSDSGEVFLVPPSIGLSTELLNRDHHEVYFAGTPRGPGGMALRRHGDEMQRLGAGSFQAHGRADDTMNLGGIKTSSAEIERLLNGLPRVHETAAVAVPPPGGGPDRLVIYVVIQEGQHVDPGGLKDQMQQAIKEHLNPLFRIHEVRVIDALPRTASNKVMRRALRARFQTTA